jgi:V-type H+-transporting ATPase subunit a
MFGDVMHGAILFIFASYLCFCHKEPGSAMEAFGKIKYLLLLMGLFSTFCGFIYNDFTSIPMKLFGESCYEVPHGGHGKVIVNDPDCIYPIGVDPSWYLGKNELTYMNSLKMKISVIFGVMQMSLGVFMKAMNSKEFNRPIDFIFEFVPQIILLLALFGFMDLLIIVKWLTNFEVMTDGKPPSVITSMIAMCLNFGE